MSSSAYKGATSTRADPFDAGMFRARNDRYLTPLHYVRALGVFDLDPCGAPGHATADLVWTPEEVGDGLSYPWAGRVWLNPPYGRAMRPWLERLAVHGTGTALIPAAPDTAVWHDVVFPYGAGILFPRGRINFGGGAAPNHASVFVAFGAGDADALQEAAHAGIAGKYLSIPKQ